MLKHASFQNRNRTQGFTLIEVMITVAIVAIVATIAVPAYTSYITSSRRTDAIKAINIAANMLENCKNNSVARNYAGCLTLDGSDNILGLDTKYYDVKVTVSDLSPTLVDLAYVLSATPKSGSGQAKDIKCAKFLLDQKGVYSAQDSGGSASTGCWKQ